jgi:adenylate kinase family enzyme
MIVELVGPAGAGKTTLSRVLRQRNKKILIGSDIQLRKIEHIPIFIRSIPSSISLFLAQERSERWFTWEELKSIAYLKGWPHLLRNESYRGQFVLLDQGPVYRLATLLGFGPQMPQKEADQKWWGDLYEAWACTLDMIVWLDASDDVLVKRINTRRKEHVIKGKSDPDAQQFLTRYRMAYLNVLSRLESYNGPTVLPFDTGTLPVEQIADDILNACRLKLDGC